MAKKRIDWVTVKGEYIEGIIDEDGNRLFPTSDILAERHQMSRGTLLNRLCREKWLKERDKFVKEVEATRKEQKIQTLVGESAVFNAKTLKIADKGLTLIAKKFKESFTNNSPLSTSDHANLSSALKNYQQVGRLALGETTESSLVKGDAARPTINLYLEQGNAVLPQLIQDKAQEDDEKLS